MTIGDGTSNLTGDYVTIASSDGLEFSAYRVEGAGGPHPGLVVVQEIFGVNQNMRQICNDYAAQGFTVYCPDLFHRIEPMIQLTDQTEQEWQQAFGYMEQFDREFGVMDIQSTIDVLRKDEACTRKVGVVGYCLGGTMAYMSGCYTDVNASIGYYPVQIVDYLTEASDIRAPMILHIAEQDAYMPADDRDEVIETLDSHDCITLYEYAEMDHAFARIGGDNFDAINADLANTRTLDVLKTTLA